MFGRHEHLVAQLYRALFMDLDDLAAKIQIWAPQATRILEVGCGEGAVTEKLAELFPEAMIYAIDITPRVGRLYRGSKRDVEFRTAHVQDIALSNPGRFDLILMTDVIHHIPHHLRSEIMDAVSLALAPEGRFILKDWAKSRSLIHWLCYAGDRWLTGDRVSHMMPSEARQLVMNRVTSLRKVGESHIKPWRNNYAMVFVC
jgi:2-polyprenyl-3-methyl-5-hydroxy-6-metoxy-1,4-benzoquinol methylase